MFANRREAGRLLAQSLLRYKDENPVVLALPRGGVEVGYEVARALNAPLDVLIARKLGAPGQPELAIGAVVDGDHPEAVLNRDVMRAFGVSDEYLDRVVRIELREIERRQRTYRQGRPPLPLDGATVIVVDDGIATGASVRAALRGLRRRNIRKLVLAVPVAPPSTAETLKPEVDDLVCLKLPADFRAVGLHYRDFEQTSDQTVIELLAASNEALSEPVVGGS